MRGCVCPSVKPSNLCESIHKPVNLMSRCFFPAGELAECVHILYMYLCILQNNVILCTTKNISGKIQQACHEIKKSFRLKIDDSFHF